MPPRKRVLLVIETSRAYGRGCLRGVASYARAHRNWHIVHLERGLAEPLPVAITRWQGDGILARIENDEIAATIGSLNVPTIDLLGLYHLPRGASIGTDHQAAALQAADHLLERGLRHLAYCGYPGIAFSDQRGRAFGDYLKHEHGIETYAWQPAACDDRPPSGTLEQESYGETHLEELLPWIHSLPKPAGIMACNDVRGRQVINACELDGVKVPEQAAVVGVDNDEVICELSDPPLSSVVPDTHCIGFEAAALLDRLMEGEVIPPQETILIPPKFVETRLSSDILALDDQELVKVVRFIRENACQGINVADVSRHCRMSRSTLERRFARHFGYGPKEQILRMRFERVKSLLLETDYDLREVARLTGFSTTAHLAASFKTRTGMTPGEFRDAGTA